MIDSHCHLADKKFSKDLNEVISRAKQAGVSRIVTIADTLEESEKCIRIAEQYPEVFCTVGVHPHAANEFKIQNSKFKIHGLIGCSEKVVAVGEIGLDYHYDFSPRDVQREVFKEQLIIAREMDFPAVIHCRTAIGDLKRIINEIGHSKIVIHCCTEKWEDVIGLVDRGFKFGFTGIATYPNAAHIRETIKNCPLDQIMVETDAPYLSPQSKRGRRNEPAFVIEVVKLISEVKRVSFEEVDEVTTRNAMEFFGINS